MSRATFTLGAVRETILTPSRCQPFALLILAILLWSGFFRSATGQTYTPGQAIDDDYSGFAKSFLANHCVDCHGESDPEGDLSLDDLGPIDEVNAGVWRSVWAQVSLQEMPPKDASQPEVVARLQFTDWIVGQLSHAMREKGGFHDHLDPDKANFLDHDLLFSPLPKGIKLVPTSHRPGSGA